MSQVLLGYKIRLQAQIQRENDAQANETAGGKESAEENS